MMEDFDDRNMRRKVVRDVFLLFWDFSRVKVDSEVNRVEDGQPGPCQQTVTENFYTLIR